MPQPHSRHSQPQDVHADPVHDDNLTTLLNAWTHGEPSAAERLIPVLYPLMRRIAEGLFAHERVDHTLQPTALVHDCYLRMADLRHMRWLGREHFLSTAARLMRRLLVDHARAARCRKRGGDVDRQPLTSDLEIVASRADELIALDEALFALRCFDPRKAMIVELQYFGGFSFREIAQLLDSSRSTVIRHWTVARLWLLRELSARGDETPGPTVESQA